MDFDYFWKKQRKIAPDEPKYISLCKILMGSGVEKEEITNIFLSHMTEEEDYDKPELEEMVNYLVDISKDIND